MNKFDFSLYWIKTNSLLKKILRPKKEQQQQQQKGNLLASFL